MDYDEVIQMFRHKDNNCTLRK